MAPYKKVISGFILDPKVKNVKITGNVVDPNKVSNQIGADVLEFG